MHTCGSEGEWSGVKVSTENGSAVRGEEQEMEGKEKGR